MQLNFPDFAQKLRVAQQEQAMAGPMAQGATAGVGGGISPEQITEPAGPVSADPASAALSQVKLPPL